MNPTSGYQPAPELDVVDWINTPDPLELSALRGKVVVLHAFQMLCPGCVTHGIPQASVIHDLYAKEGVQVIGLHTVFEHHEVMNVDALKVFIQEYRINFPVGVDRPSTSSPVPITMGKYQMKGTPTLVLIDKRGQIRLNHFGRLNDMSVGGLIGALLAEEAKPLPPTEDDLAAKDQNATDCGENGCTIRKQ